MFRKKNQPKSRHRPVNSRNQPESKNKKTTSLPSTDMRNRTDRHSKQEKILIKKKPAWRMLPSFIALSAIILSGVYALQLDVDNARIRIADTGNDKTILSQVDSRIADQAKYQQTFSELLSSSVMNRTKLTVRSVSIIEDFQKLHPEVVYAEVRYGLVDSKPILFVVLREPHVVIAAEDADVSYVVDISGVAFSQLAREDLLEGVPYIEDSISVEVEIGQQILPAETIQYIDAVIHQLEAAEHTVESLSLPAIANELHVRLAGDEFVGKFDITGNPQMQSGSFIATRNQLLEENEAPNEYIDVRVSGRAYYR